LDQLDAGELKSPHQIAAKQEEPRPHRTHSVKSSLLSEMFDCLARQNITQPRVRLRKDASQVVPSVGLRVPAANHFDPGLTFLVPEETEIAPERKAGNGLRRFPQECRPARVPLNPYKDLVLVQPVTEVPHHQEDAERLRLGARVPIKAKPRVNVPTTLLIPSVMTMWTQ